MIPQVGEDITLKAKFCIGLLKDEKIVHSSTMQSLNNFMVLFVAVFLEIHVFIPSCTISLMSYHREHSKTTTYHTRLLQLRKNGITITSRQRTCEVSLRFPTFEVPHICYHWFLGRDGYFHCVP
jgi:hypothetical protein